MIKLLKSKRGEGYIDVVVSVLVIMMLIVLALNVFSFMTLKQDMDYFAREMVECACADGKTNGEVISRFNELTDEIGFSPSYTWTTDYYNDSYKTVQLGETIRITVTYQTYIKGFGIFQIPITLTVNYSGLSQKYWK